LKKINERKREYSQEWPAINITYTISNYNYRDMRKFVQWFHEQDMDIESITFSHLWFKDKAIVNEHNIRYGDLFSVKQENLIGLNISEIDMDFVYDELRLIKKTYAKSPFPIFEHPGLTCEEAKNSER